MSQTTCKHEYQPHIAPYYFCEHCRQVFKKAFSRKEKCYIFVPSKEEIFFPSADTVAKGKDLGVFAITLGTKV